MFPNFFFKLFVLMTLIKASKQTKNFFLDYYDLEFKDHTQN